MADPYADVMDGFSFTLPDMFPSAQELEGALAQSLLEGENDERATMRQNLRYGKTRSRFSQAEEDVTALMLASAKYTPEHVVALLDHGADLARTDVFEWTALHHAAAHARDDIVQLLLSHGADAGAEDDEGETPLIVAMRCESSEAELTSTVNHLLATQKADVDHKNGYGRTALMLACYYGHHEVAKALLLAGADLDAVDEGGETARSLVTRFSGEPEQFERVFEWYESELQRAYLLHRARRVFDDHMAHIHSPSASQPPKHLQARVAAGGDWPAVEVVGAEEEEGQLLKAGEEEGVVVAEEEAQEGVVGGARERCDTARFLVEGLDASLFIELQHGIRLRRDK